MPLLLFNDLHVTPSIYHKLHLSVFAVALLFTGLIGHVCETETDIMFDTEDLGITELISEKVLKT